MPQQAPPAPATVTADVEVDDEILGKEINEVDAVDNGAPMNAPTVAPAPAPAPGMRSTRRHTLIIGIIAFLKGMRGLSRGQSRDGSNANVCNGSNANVCAGRLMSRRAEAAPAPLPSSTASDSAPGTPTSQSDTSAASTLLVGSPIKHLPATRLMAAAGSLHPLSATPPLLRKLMASLNRRNAADAADAALASLAGTRSTQNPDCDLLVVHMPQYVAACRDVDTSRVGSTYAPPSRIVVSSDS